MSTLPYVSIIVAAYNSEKTIGKCIESLLALDYKRYEIIIVDNNSSDKTAEIVKQYDVSYQFEKRRGWPAARNTGIKHSKAEFVANIDADCFASPNWLKILMKGFTAGDVGCVVGKTLVEKGKTMALASDLSKHWGTGFLEWKGYKNFWYNTLKWMTGK